MDNINNKNNKNVNKKEWAKCSLYIVYLWGRWKRGETIAD